MMTSSLLKDLLFISNPKVLGFCTYLNKTALMFILPTFYIGIIVECFGNFDFKGVSKRAVIAFLAIKLLVPIHVGAVDQSLEVSSKLLKRYSPQNKFLMAYQKAKNDDMEKKGVWGKLTSIVKMVVDDPIVMIIFLLSYIAFFLLTQLYSLTYHLTIAMIGLCAVLSILPITSGSLKGAMKSSLWCILMPFVVAIILCLIGDSDAFFKTYSGGIVQNLESLIQLLIMTIILLLAPMITSKIMSDSGVSHLAENLGQMAAMSTLIGGATATSKIASQFIGSKGSAMGSMIHNSTSKPVMNKIKGTLSNKAQAIANEKGLGPSIKTLTSKSGMEKLKGGMSDLSDNLKNTSFKEKVVLGADSIINKRENGLAREARHRQVNKSNPSGNSSRAMPNNNGSHSNPSREFSKSEFRDLNHSHNPKVPLASFKREASDYLKGREALINRPKMSHQFLQHRNLQARAQRPDVNSKMAVSGSGMESRKDWRTSKGKGRGGLNDHRYV